MILQRLKRQVLSRVGFVRVGMIAAGLVIAVATWMFVVKPISTKGVALWEAYNMTLPQYQGRTNFLLLGIAGGDHDGADLTDTIIFMSARHSDGQVTLLSIPRDVWVPSMRAKINTALYYGEQKKEGGGFTLAKAAVSEIINQPIHFVATIDFANFEKVIDSLGGVDIDVAQEFDDYKYPIPGKEDDLCNGDDTYACRFEHLHFSAGMQHMDGATALKYVRSRQAEGHEGTDFARSQRQEKLLLALKDKLLSRGLLTDLKKIRSLYDSVSSAVVSDVTSDQYPALARLGLSLAKANDIQTSALAEPDQLFHPLNSAPYDGQWVLLPKDNAQTVFDFVAELLNKD